MTSPKVKQDTPVYHYIAASSNVGRAANDLAKGMMRYRLFSDMAIRGFRNRYRGALLGPFWITITTTMTAAGLGLLYGQLFNLPLAEHLPYVTSALIVWSTISALLTGGCGIFVGNSHIIKEFPLPTSLYVYRMVISDILGLGFRLIVLITILILFKVPISYSSLLAIPGLMLIYWIGFWTALGLGVINARFRDFGQLVSAALTFIFFVTPIFWLPDRLGSYSFVVDFNPFYHIIQVVRGPLLDTPGLLVNFTVVGGLSILTPLIGLGIYGKWSHRLPYWV